MAESNIRFIVVNEHDKAALTASSEAVPVASTQKQSKAHAWRTQSVGVHSVTAQMGQGPAYANGFCMAQHNLSKDSEYRLVLKLQDVTVYDSGLIPVQTFFIPAGTWRAGIDPWMAADNDKLAEQCTSLWFDAVLFDSYEITVSDPKNSAGWLQVGRFFLGVAISPAVNMDYNARMTHQESGRHSPTDGGSLWTVGKGSRRQFDIDLNHLSMDERLLLEGELVAAGLAADIFISAYPGAGGLKEIQHQFIAKRQPGLSFTHNNFNNCTTKLQFFEV